MLDLGWTELLVIGVVALIVVGPKDLPKMFHTLGQFTARVRRMARDFSRAMEDAADSSGAKDMARDLRKATSPRAMGVDALKKAADFDLDDPFDENGADDPVAAKRDTGKAGDTTADPSEAASTETASTQTAHGPHTRKLSEERQEAARKIREYTAQKGLERQAAAEAARSPAPGDDGPATSDADATTDGKA